MKILYAEDEPQLSMAVTEILKIENYDVDAVYDGDAALHHLKSGYYDAAVLDIMMPKKGWNAGVDGNAEKQNIYAGSDADRQKLHWRTGLRD